MLLVTSIFPPEAGGPATFISALAPALVKAGHQVRVFTLWDESPADKPDWLFGLPRTWPAPARLGRIFLALLRHVLWADLVYVNGLELPAVTAARLLGRPCILKIVGDYAWERLRTQGKTDLSIDAFQLAPLAGGAAVQRWLRGWYTRRAGLVVTPSNYLAGLVLGWGAFPERVRVIVNGLTPNSEPIPSRRPEGQGAKTILTAARLVNWKGVDHLIAALAELGPEVRLRVLGDGPDRARLVGLADRLGLTERVVFSGRVGRSRVLDEMARADVFALASGYEGLPHVVLEAFAVGVPVVAAAAGGTPEVVRHGANGLLAPYGRPKILASVLNKVLSDPDLAAQLGRAGQESLTEFDWSTAVAGHVRAIEDRLK